MASLSGAPEEGTSDRPSPPSGDWLGTPFLRFERHGPLARCVVDRPERRNAMTPAMYFGVRYAVDHVNAEAALAGLLLTGTGDVFIPGGDLGGEGEDDWGEGLRLLGMDLVPFDAIRHSPKPVVSAVNGLCQGGGLMMAMLSDVTVAAESATFRCPELFRGITDTYYAQVLPRQIGPARARDMFLTGRQVTSEEALAWGLVARVVPDDRLLDEATAALEWCCRAAPEARREAKRVMDQFYGTFDRVTMDRSLSGPEAVEGYHAFKERRSPSWVPEDLRTEGRI